MAERVASDLININRHALRKLVIGHNRHSHNRELFGVQGSRFRAVPYNSVARNSECSHDPFDWNSNLPCEITLHH